MGAWIAKKAYAWLPVVQYVEEKKTYEAPMEDEETIAKILESQANDEHAVDENGKLIGAVTHVFVQDSTKGYGIFIENMLKQVNLPEMCG